MGIDANIALGYRQPQIESQANMLQTVLALQNAQQAGQMNTLQMNKLMREDADDNQLRDLTRQSGGDLSKLQQLAYGAGNCKQGMAVAAQITAQKKAQLENDKTTQEMAVKGEEAYKGYVRRMYDTPDLTPDTAAEMIKQGAAAGIIPSAMAPQLIAAIPTDPAKLKPWVQSGYNSQLDPAKRIEIFAPKLIERTNGQTKNMFDSNTLSPTGGQNVGAPVQIMQDPNSIASNTQSDVNSRRSAAASMANAGATREVANATRDAARIQTGFKNEQDLRKEFESLDEVKSYKQAFPAYASIKDAVGRNTTQSDINIVYGLAKLYDPTSVVREGEYATVANSPNIPEKVKGYAQYLQGGGRLSPETKRQIMAEATGRLGSYEAEVTKAKGSYEEIARKRGMDPTTIFADTGNITARQKTETAAPAGMPKGFKVIR